MQPIYKTVRRTKYEGGKKIADEYVRVKLKPSEIKQTIMRANDWNEDQYRKQYDLFKNKLRAYESYVAARKGLSIEEQKQAQQSPLELLYKNAKAKERYGSEYEPSIAFQRVQEFSPVSITKGRKLARQEGSTFNIQSAKKFSRATNKAFREFIEQVPKAKEIDEKISDPVRKEEALAALAKHIHAKQRPNGAPVSSEAVGSDVAGEDFYIEQWL